MERNKSFISSKSLKVGEKANLNTDSSGVGDGWIYNSLDICAHVREKGG